MSIKEKKQRVLTEIFLYNTVRLDGMILSCYNGIFWLHHSMGKEDEYISRVVVNVQKRTVNCISSDGEEKLVECKKPQEFVNVLEFCKTVLDPEDVFFEEIKVAAE